MNKYDFLTKIDLILNKLGLNLFLFIEHSIKISPTYFSNDRVNFKISSNELSFNNLILIIKELGFSNKTYEFIDFVYKNYKKEIKYIFFGFDEGNYEIYFEKWIRQDNLYFNMTDIISYDIQNDIIYNYSPFNIKIDNSKKYLINNLINFCKTYKVDLSNHFNHFGYLKNNGYCHIGYFNSNNDFFSKLENISLKINNSILVSDWFKNNKDKYLTLIGYHILNESLTMSIYYK